MARKRQALAEGAIASPSYVTRLHPQVLYLIRIPAWQVNG